MTGAPTGAPGDAPKRDLLTIRVPRAALFLLVGLMAGFVIGFWVSRALVPPTRIVVPPNQFVSTPAPTVATPSPRSG
jgi:hypothetical protein